MRFVHDDLDFADLLRIVASRRGLAPGLVEKDYWVTHALWALHHQGFDVWFKGGTSLSKGFGLIERFSEDLDLKVEPGVTSMPPVANWKSEGTAAVAARRASFAALADRLVVPGAPVAMDAGTPDRFWRGVKLRVTYPGLFLGDLGEILRPFVLLERWQATARVYEAIAPMYWRPRMSLDAACAAIRSWPAESLA